MNAEDAANIVADARYRELLIDGICGVGFPTIQTAMDAEKAGFARFTGNQHNPAWEWVRESFSDNPTEDILAIYVGLKKEQQQ